jgi:hypothetical protein
MTTTTSPRLVTLIESLIGAIQSDDFEALKLQRMLGPSSVNEYRAAFKTAVGMGKLTMVPRRYLEALELTEFHNPHRFRIDLDLWIDEKRSDWTATLYYRPSLKSGEGELELYDLRVL